MQLFITIVIGHAWNHETRDFDIIYRPLYHCEPKSGIFEAHLFAISTFTRWKEKKFEQVDYTTLPYAARGRVVWNPCWIEPSWKREEFTSDIEWNFTGESGREVKRLHRRSEMYGSWWNYY